MVSTVKIKGYRSHTCARRFNLFCFNNVPTRSWQLRTPQQPHCKNVYIETNLHTVYIRKQTKLEYDTGLFIGIEKRTMSIKHLL